MCNRQDAVAILGKVYERCMQVIPIVDAYLYGSYARGDYDAESDVDIILVTSLPSNKIWPVRRRISRIANELSMEHDVSVSICVRSEEQFQPQIVPYYKNVVREGIRYSRILGE